MGYESAMGSGGNGRAEERAINDCWTRASRAFCVHFHVQLCRLNSGISGIISLLVLGVILHVKRLLWRRAYNSHKIRPMGVW